MAMKENSKTVYNYVKANDGQNFTAQDIANATGLPIRTVNGIITSAFCRHRNEDGEIVPLMERSEPISIKVDGIDKIVKYITLTAEGRAFDIENA